jgi:hypothetical protein
MDIVRSGGMAMERDWRFVPAVAVKGFIKYPASMSIAGAVGYTVSCYRDRTSDTHHNS